MITEPILIFQDELFLDGMSNPVIDGPGALVCSSRIVQPQWRDVIGNTRITGIGAIKVMETSNSTTWFSQLIRGNEAGSNSTDRNGLITCRVGASDQEVVDVIASIKYVALYIRQDGE